MVTRQSGDTRIFELEGQQCEAVVGVSPSDAPNSLMYAYLKIGRGWYRFFIDVGALFFHKSPPPCDDDDLDEFDRWVDVLEGAAITLRTIDQLEFVDKTLTLALSDGLTIRFVEDPETELMEVTRTPA